METTELLQGSDEWLQARVGSVGASTLHEAVARTKSGWSKSRDQRMATLAIERLTGKPVETYVNAAMQQGTEREPMARAAYEFYRNVTVEEIGLMRHPTIEGTHASPDGLVGEKGLLEIKSPMPAQHMATLLGEPIKDQYVVQMQWQMRVCDREWTDFVSFNPDFPESMALYVERVFRDDKRIAELEDMVRQFLSELDGKVAELRKRYEPTEAEMNLMAG